MNTDFSRPPDGTRKGGGGIIDDKASSWPRNRTHTGPPCTSSPRWAGTRSLRLGTDWHRRGHRSRDCDERSAATNTLRVRLRHPKSPQKTRNPLENQNWRIEKRKSFGHPDISFFELTALLVN